MIYRKSYYELDDCDTGTYTIMVDWRGCSESHKQHLIKEFKLVDKIVVPDEPIGLIVHKPSEYYTMGCQTIPEPKRLKSDNCSVLQSEWCTILNCILIPTWLVCFPMFIVGPDIPTVGAICIALLTTPLVGILGALAGAFIGFLQHLGQTSRYNKKKDKFDEQTKFENWIKGCRHGRN